MLILRSDRLMVRIDPRHGAEVIDLIDLASGRQLLGRPPFGSTPPVAGDLDELTWTRAYRGGWQMLTPNAGLACKVGETWHGFHGQASNHPWRIVDSTPVSAHLKWTGHGLKVNRVLTIDGATLSVLVRLQAVKDRIPFVVVEHVAVGLELLDPAVDIVLPGNGGLAMEIDPGRALPASTKGVPWPQACMLDGTIQRVDRWLRDRPCSRMVCAMNLTAGGVMVQNQERDMRLMIRWDSDYLKHLWMWHEVRMTDGPWRGLGELLVLEPATVPHHGGLAEAIVRGEALWLDAGQAVQYTIQMTTDY